NKLNMNTIDDLYAAIGHGNIKLSQIITRLRQFYKKSDNKIQEDTAIDELKKTSKKSSGKLSQGVSIVGADNIKVRFAKCCNPVPGDDIIGFITKGRGVSIHRADCPNIQQVDDTHRFLQVDWDSGERDSYSAEIQVRAVDRGGLLAEIALKVNHADVDILSINARTNKENYVIINMVLEIKD